MKLIDVLFETAFESLIFFSPLTHTELHNPCHTHPTPPHYICLFVTRFACLFLFFPSAKAIIQLNFFAIVCGLFVLFPTFRCYNVQLPVLISIFFFLVLFFSLSFWSQQQAGLSISPATPFFFFLLLLLLGTPIPKSTLFSCYCGKKLVGKTCMIEEKGYKSTICEEDPTIFFFCCCRCFLLFFFWLESHLCWVLHGGGPHSMPHWR